MEKQITVDGRMFIESLFEFERKDMGNVKFGTLRFVGERLRDKKGYETDYRLFVFTHMRSMQKKYGHAIGHGDEFTGAYATAITEAVAMLGDRFPDFEVFKSDKKVQLGTMKYIKIELQKILYMLANPETFQTRNGKSNVFIHTDTMSLDAVKEAYQKNDGEFELSEENRLFGRDISEDEYHQFTYYVEHFLNNKERILTKKQLDFYEAVKDVYVPQNASISKEKAFEEVGYSVPQFNKFKQNIKKRMEQDFEKFGKKKATNTNYRESLIKILKNFIEVADSDDNLKNMQLNLTRIIQDNYDKSEDFEVIITGGLKVEEKINIVRAVKGKEYVENKVLYKVYDNIFKYLEKHELIDVEASETKSTYTEVIFGKKQKSNTATHYKINASGVAVPMNFEDIVESDES